MKKRAKVYANHPRCVNLGCNNYALVRNIPLSGKIGFRPHCNHCQKASYGAHAHKPNVIPFKKNICSNQDGHLGFACVVNWPNLPNWAKGLTEIDHIDGNSSNDELTNLQELCTICHKLKGQKNGDYNSFRKRKTLSCK